MIYKNGSMDVATEYNSYKYMIECACMYIHLVYMYSIHDKQRSYIIEHVFMPILFESDHKTWRVCAHRWRWVTVLILFPSPKLTGFIRLSVPPIAVQISTAFNARTCAHDMHTCMHDVCDLWVFEPKFKVPTPQRDILSLPGSSIVKMFPHHLLAWSPFWRAVRRRIRGCIPHAGLSAPIRHFRGLPASMMCTHTCARKYIYIYIHTHTHTYAHA